MNRYKLDENMPDEVREFLEELRLDVHTVAQELLVGAPDPVVGAACALEKRILITFDKDFGDVRTVSGYEDGIILLRLTRQEPEYLVPVLRTYTTVLCSMDFRGLLVVLTERRMRIRTLR